MPSPLPPRVLSALVAVSARLEKAGVEWLLAGSAARALMALRARPRDIDIEVSLHGAARAPEALGVRLRYDEARGRASWRGRGEVAGVEVDLTCDLEVTGPGGRLRPDFALQRAWAVAAPVAGGRVLLAPLEEAVARAVAGADWPALARLTAEAAAAGERAPALRPAYLALRLSSAASRAAR